MADIRTMKLNLLADVSKFSTGINTADKEAKGLSGKMEKYGKRMAKAFALAAVAAGAMAVKIGLEGVQAASDLNEEISKSEVIFGDVANEIKDFARTADRALGLTQKEALSAASTFATFGKAAGLSGKELSTFSRGATTLASDLASFYNTNADEAITAIGAALRGESEPIRKYGVLLNDATLKAKAMEMGLYDGKGALDLQAKSLAAYQVILDQTKDAQGDFSRTSEGLAAQQKILRAQMENLKTTIGISLLPTMKDIVTQANFVAAAFGGKDPESLSERARELAGTYDGQGAGGYNLGLALKNLADAFSQLFNSLNNDKDADGTLNSIAAALVNVANGINSVANAYRKAKGVGGKVLDFLEIGDGGLKFADTALGKRLGYTNRATGGGVTANQPYMVGEFGPELFVPSGSGSIRPNVGGSGTTIINLNGIVDAESARRSIERLLQNSSRRTGAINLVGATL